MSSPKITTSATIDIFPASSESELELPLISGGISAGFPSPALDFIDVTIDLNKHVVKHPSCTFYGKVKGESMRDEGINDGDLLVIDKSLEPADGKIAICNIDGEFTVKKIKLEKELCWLMPANENYQPIKVTRDNNLIIWGIVTHVLKSF